MRRISDTFLFIILLIIVFKKCAFAATHSASSVREVSHEDIRDAIMSLVNIFRDNTDKLERHEARERQLGDLLKKSFTSVEKKQNIEATNMSTVLDILNNINARLETIENKTKLDERPNEENTQYFQRLEFKLTKLEELLQKNEMNFQTIKSDINSKLDSIMSDVASLQQKLLQNSSPENSQATSISTKFYSKLEEILPQFEKNRQILDGVFGLQQITTQNTATILENLQHSVKIEDLKEFLSLTADQLRELRQNTERISENEILKLKEIIEKSQEILLKEQQSVLVAISDASVTNQGLNENVGKSYDQLLTEIKSLSKIDQLLTQTADNVLDAKRRVEYGTHQILLEVGDIIKLSAQDTNETINKRFDMISNEIVNNQNGALKNLSSKIETEISQVWRQIGIMYQTLTNSADALNKLQHQTEIYVNGSLNTMDNMEGKVGLITSRMSEVDENLNYLLGRLSLVTQEFNQIKTGLGEALDSIRTSFHAVRDKVKDVGPGPNPIEEDVTAFDDLLKKTKYTTS